jgi:hypothetical protein
MLISDNVVNKTASGVVASKTCSFKNFVLDPVRFEFDSLLVGSEESVHL